MTALSNYLKLRKFVKALSVYEKNPPEIIKDDFAYDRLLDFIHNMCKKALITSSKKKKDK